MSKSKKARNFEFQRSYKFDTENENHEKVLDITEDEWKRKIIETMKKSGHDELWLIFHDKDIIPDSMTIKPLHAHGVIVDKSARNIDVVKLSVGVVKDDYDKNFQKVKKSSSMFRYLTHTTDKAMQDKKYRYGIDELYLFIDGQEITDRARVRDLYTKRIVGKERDTKKDNLNETVKSLIAQIGSYEITLKDAKKELRDKFGDAGLAEYYIKHTTFQAAYEDYLSLMRNDYIKNGRDLTTVYVYGDSNIGKSTFVEQFAEYVIKQENLDIDSIYDAPSNRDGSSSYDLLSKYKDEDIAIIDDVPASRMQFDMFNKAFNPTKVQSLGSRYHDKYFFSTKAFIVKSEEPNDYFRQIYEPQFKVENATTEKHRINIKMQTLRRAKYWIKITEKKVEIFRPDINKLKSSKSDCGSELIMSFEIDFKNCRDEKKVNEMYRKMYELMYN